MKPYAAGGIAVLLLVALGVVGAYSQADMTHVDNSVFPDPERPSAVFPHDEHNAAAEIDACNRCHHVYEDGELLEYDSSEGEWCSDCHGLKAEGRMPGLRKAFHLSCRGCHLENRAGPVMCGECHRKAQRIHGG